jgi:hypothetical protein
MATEINIDGVTGGFDIKEFRSVINRRGILQGSHYQVMIQPPQSILNTTGVDSTFLRDLTFYAESAIIPGVAFATSEVRNEAIGPVKHVPYAPMFSKDMMLYFIIDEKGAMIDFFHQWMRTIINYSSGGTALDRYTFNGAHPYEVAYEDEYMAEVGLRLMSPIVGANKAPQLVAHYMFHKTYPSAIHDVTVSYSFENAHLVLPVSMTYFDFEVVTAASTATPATKPVVEDTEGAAPTIPNAFNNNITNKPDVTGSVTTRTDPSRTVV